MTPILHILATVLKPERTPAALLLFRSLRVGFPTATVKVWGNGLDDVAAAHLARACAADKAEFTNLAMTSHDAWIEALLEESLTPFWICDTDVVFWRPVEEWFSDANYFWPETIWAGRFEPEFHEEWTNTRHMERLHTCLMWFNPAKVRTAMRKWAAQIPMLWRRQADFPFVRQHFVPLAGELPMFYDTCAGLYHAIGGTRFTEEQDEAFEHLHCATYADQITAPGLKTLKDGHDLIYQGLQSARGLRQRQNEYYQARRLPPLKPTSVGDKITKGKHAIQSGDTIAR
jgi:hypothetical protein